MGILVIALGIIYFLPQTRSSSDDPNCRGWNYYKPDNIYTKAVHTYQNWSASKQICENLGGQLMALRNREISTFMGSKLTNYIFKYYWFGLYGGKSQVYYLDGTPLKQDDYQPWEQKLTSYEGKCAEVIFRRHSWDLIPCTTRRSCICDAAEICDSRPAIMLEGDDKRRERGIIPVSIKENSETRWVKCYASGYKEKIIKVQLTCEWKNTTNNITGHTMDLTYEKRLVFNASSHMGVCECKTFEPKYKTNAITISFHVQFPVKFVNGGDAEPKSYELEIGQDLVHSVDLYSNPVPTIFELTFFGDPLKMHEFNWSVESLDEPLLRLTISMSDMQRNMSGLYTYSVYNGFGDELSSDFKVYVIKKKIIDNESNTGLSLGSYFIISALAFALICCVLAAYFKGNKHKDSLDDLGASSDMVEQKDRASDEEKDGAKIGENDQENEGDDGSRIKGSVSESFGTRSIESGSVV